MRRLLSGGVAGLPAAAAGVSVAAVLAAGPNVCPVALLTGTPCPGCGLTRAAVALARGDLAAAWTAHPLAGAVVAVTATLGVWWAAARWSLVRPPSPRPIATVLSVLSVALVVVWAIRLASGTLPLV